MSRDIRNRNAWKAINAVPKDVLVDTICQLCSDNPQAVHTSAMAKLCEHPEYRKEFLRLLGEESRPEEIWK